MHWMACLIAVILMGCGSAPTSPSPPPAPAPSPSPAPAPRPVPAPAPSVTITGTITSTTTGAVVGAFVHTVNTLPAQVTVSAAGYVTRQTWVTSTTPRVDLFPESGFNLAFYRQLARDSFGSGANALQPLWTLPQSPSFYMEVEGTKGLATSVGVRLEAVARRIVPAMTGGRLQVVRWETGPTPRAPQVGWIMVERRDEQGICGRAYVGATAGQIWMDGNGQNCSFEAVFAHEVGHALGFFHTDRAGSMMFPQGRNSNLADAPSEIERHHAALAYARPRFNRDIDVDPRPSSTAGLSAAPLILD